MSATYFWDGEQLIIVPEQVWLENSKPYLDMYCVDGYAGTEKVERYGMFVNDTGQRWGCYWGSRPLAEFPKEFRAHLLLLGVT